MQERMPSAQAAEMPPIAPAGLDAELAGPPHLADPRTLQILSTEHWSLLSQRSLAWTETFARASMFLATLSAATVALALAGSIMGEGFIVFALVVLPVVLFIGLTTVVRLFQANTDDFAALQGMNRIRHAYLELVPGLEPYFVTSRYDDMAGVMVTSGAPPAEAGKIAQPTVSSALAGFLHGFVTTLGMISIINCVVAAVFVGLVVAALGGDTGAAIAAGIIGFLALLAVQAIWGLAALRQASARMIVRFPSPPPGR